MVGFLRDSKSAPQPGRNDTVLFSYQNKPFLSILPIRRQWLISTAKICLAGAHTSFSTEKPVNRAL